MEKSKTWITDRLTANDFQTGDTVMLVRRKKNGHPRAIKDNTPYKIKRIENDCLVLFRDGSVSATLFQPKEFKVHFSYFLNTQTVRDEIINELLKD